LGHAVVVLRNNGTGIQRQDGGANHSSNWICNDGTLDISWSNGVTDHMTLSSNGRRLSGNGAMGMAVTGDRR
jgi:hypothetical protein